MLNRRCLHCQKPFQAHAAHVRQGRGKYCSPQCGVAARTREVKRPGKQARTCQECETTFYTYPASPQRFCVRACRSAYDRRPEVIAQRFWRFYDRSGDCWLWTGSITPGGYGKFGLHTPEGIRSIGAHRLAWVLANGELIPEGMNVCHRCDIRHCGNPTHLFLGTQKDNIRDMFTKGRNSFHLPSGHTWVPSA